MAKACRAVPHAMQEVFEAIVGVTDKVRREHLNEEYAELAQDMPAALCRKRPSPRLRGNPQSWACGIVYALGQLNFLSDPTSKPTMKTAELAAKFGVGESTASAKASSIRRMLKTNRLDPRWCMPSRFDSNPLVWFAQLNDIIVDLRRMPREVQEPAFNPGMIPYIPADRA